jgi:hypothetical protein
MSSAKLIVPLLATAAAAWGGQAALPAPARAATTVSTNWGGYAATGTRFRRVTGTWRVTPVNCTAGSATYSAAWVGLGGFLDGTQSLEQTGTEVDCTRSGRAVYSAWYELVPDLSKSVRMSVHAGDTIIAAVEVRGTRVSLSLRNRTTGARFARTLRMSAPDVSSAEWIVEAPSGCTSSGNCTQLRLANFGTMRFSQARATTTAGHGGPVSDLAWTATRIALSQSGQNGSGRVSVASAPGALASALGSGGSAFSVTYAQGSGAVGKPTTTLPAVARRGA